VRKTGSLQERSIGKPTDARRMDIIQENRGQTKVKPYLASEF
jgi:hypothetical protein